MQIDTTEIQAETKDVAQRAGEIAIVDEPSCGEAVTFLRAVKTLRKRVGDTFDTPIKAAHEAHKAVIAAKREHDDPLRTAETIVKSKVGAYQDEQRRIRLEADRLLREKAELAEEERRLAEAEELEKSGRSAEAEAVIEAPAPVVAVTIPPAPKHQGITTTQRWKFRVTDSSLIPREYLSIDMVKIGGVVRSMKGQTKIPGIVAYPEASVGVKWY